MGEDRGGTLKRSLRGQDERRAFFAVCAHASAAPRFRPPSPNKQSNEPVDPDAPDGDRIANRLLVSVFEFGDAEDQYPDSLSVTVTTKWLLSPTAPSEFTDYEGIIAGGRGRFMAASGQVTVSDVVIEDNLLKEAVFNFKVYVPADLPKAW